MLGLFQNGLLRARGALSQEEPLPVNPVLFTFWTDEKPHPVPPAIGPVPALSDKLDWEFRYQQVGQTSAQKVSEASGFFCPPSYTDKLDGPTKADGAFQFGLKWASNTEHEENAAMPGWSFRGREQPARPSP